MRPGKIFSISFAKIIDIFAIREIRTPSEISFQSAIS